MVDNAVSTLTQNAHAPDVLNPPAAPSSASPLNDDKRILFDSIAQEEFDEESGTEVSTLKTVFSAFLWTGYAIAIVVAVILVWSAAKELLR